MVAELGKTRDVPVSDLKPGMKVLQNIIGVKEKVLINSGEVLTNLHIKKLEKWEKTDKPKGTLKGRKNLKDKNEVNERTEWQGGWKPSHFNPSVKVVGTTATGAEMPDVIAHPELSTAFQSKPRNSFAVGDIGQDSPLLRVMELKSEVMSLQDMNTKLGGKAIVIAKDALPATEAELVVMRDSLKKSSDELIASMREKTVHANKPDGKKG